MKFVRIFFNPPLNHEVVVVFVSKNFTEKRLNHLVKYNLKVDSEYQNKTLFNFYPIISW